MTVTRSTDDRAATTALRLTLGGRVQGVGLRPAVARWAGQLGLTGFVGNSARGVEIHVQGPAASVHVFERELLDRLPASAKVSSIDSRTAEAGSFAEFSLQTPVAEAVSSAGADGQAPLSALVPPDVAACDQCLAELQDPEDRRHGYAFTSCTACGPRHSIIDGMPYERRQTAMSGFPLCESCGREYASPGDRRFHAQTNACPACGPQLWLRDAEGQVAARKEAAVAAAARAIGDGRIVAIRGLGGYQLLADATSQAAVERLRRRKRRQGKPLAVMAASLAQAGELAELSLQERQQLAGPSGPVVLAAARHDAGLAAAVADGLGTVGVMLPTTPLHWLLLRRLEAPVVCTSGNREGEPLACSPDDALQRLAGIADMWLEHDRPIRRPIDDSVVRVIAGRAVTIRLARGLAPLPLPLPPGRPPQVALGGHQKASFAVANGSQAVLGPHIGDLDTLQARQRYAEQLTDFCQLYGVSDSELACDAHPQYFTSQWAEESGRGDVVRVQHHHAHIVAGMLENRWLDRQVLGVAFDGTGYGADGTVWGGEFLLATADAFRRVGHVRPFPLAGGERAVREPWRVATALVADAAGPAAAAQLGFAAGDPSSLLPVLARPRLSLWTTSAGRLFDGVAALALGCGHCRFEGEAAMRLEAVCDPTETACYQLPVTAPPPGTSAARQLDWRPLVRQVLRDRAAGRSPGAIAMRFHRGLARAVAALCRQFPALPVVLGGGVFQNRVLVELLQRELAADRRPLGLPGLIPPNDGGLAAGQLASAAARGKGDE